MDVAQTLQNAFTYLASFVVVLSVVVFVHEFGHFQVARWRRVAIDTFSIGFGKTLLGWRDRQGVQWKIGALPLGGYVKFADDADAMSTAPAERIQDPIALADARRRGLFHAQPLLTRALVVGAGPITNFIFSIIAFGAVAFVAGHDVTRSDDLPARIAQVNANTPAAAAGLRATDVVRSVEGQPVRNFSDLQRHIASSPGRTLALQVERDGQIISLSATPRRLGRTEVAGTLREGQGVLGVTGPLVLPSEQRIEYYSPLQALSIGANNTWSIIAQTGSYVGAVVSGRASGNQIAGPAGILMVSGQAASSALSAPETSWLGRLRLLGLTLLQLAAVLSVAVGFVNLLPIPILDGGHLLFYGIEAARGGRPLPPSAQEWAYRAGFAVMASLFLFATWNDITRLLPGAH